MQRPRRPRSRYRCRRQWRRRAERCPERTRCRSTTTGTGARGSTSVYRRPKTRGRPAGPGSRELRRSTALRSTRPARRSRKQAQSDPPVPQSTPGASMLCWLVRVKRSVTPGRDGWSPDQNHEPFTVGSRHTQSAVVGIAGKPTGEYSSALQRRVANEAWPKEGTNLRGGELPLRESILGGSTISRTRWPGFALYANLEAAPC